MPTHDSDQALFRVPAQAARSEVQPHSVSHHLVGSIDRPDRAADENSVADRMCWGLGASEFLLLDLDTGAQQWKIHRWVRD